jgi:cytochrome c peroxidase
MKCATTVSLALLVGLATATGVTSARDAGPAAPALPAPAADADFHDDGAPAAVKVELGRLLFFDKILAGNRNISCATCHHPDFGSGDGVALPLGEGPRGLGPDRVCGEGAGGAVHERVPRNAPPLFNLGAREFTRMFHDGRVEVDGHGYYESGFISPARFKLPEGLDNALAAQAMFPVTSPAEMAGQQGENEVADARAANRVAGPDGVWDRLAQRLRAIPEYVERFAAAYPDRVRNAEDIDFVLAANAIAAFEATAFRADDSPFDHVLRGVASLDAPSRRGMNLFYGKAGCVSCHAGTFQTDHEFHAIAMPQIGPGKSDGWNADYWRETGHKAFPEDFGRGRVTAREDDRYKFRTPSLRNVALTGPWGHDGAYATLEDVVRHHLDPVRALDAYVVDDDALPPIDRLVETVASGSTLAQSPLSPSRRTGFMERDAWVQSHDELRGLIARANELEPVALTDDEVADLLAFLECLTDPASRDLSALVPATVPSGLSVAD